VIILPLFADQDFNGFRVEAQEIGMRVEVRDLTTKSMQNAVYQILTDGKFSKNMKKKSLVLRDRPMSPVDTAVYWTEFVLRHEDTASLKPMVHVDWFQRRMYDGFLVIMLGVIMSIATFIYIANSLYVRISGQSVSSDIKKTN